MMIAEPQALVLDAANDLRNSISKEGSVIGDARWSDVIPPEEWEIYAAAIKALRQAGIRFMLGGAFGLAAHTGRWRNTKDIDFYLLPEDRIRASEALSAAGFDDYYPTRAYDRGWIYRATRSGMIVDLIWGTPNRRAEVDPFWLAHAVSVSIRGEMLEVIPAEELLWIKLYVLQRDRCDWPDLVNLLYCTCSDLDWDRLVDRAGDDWPLLTGFLSVFSWLCPGRVRDIPAALRRRAGIRVPKGAVVDFDPHRIALLDSRPWFAPELR